AEGRAVRRRELGDLGKRVVIRAHHDAHDRGRDAEPSSAIGLVENEPPVSGTTPRVLLALGRKVERELDVGEPTELLVVDGGRREPVRRQGDRRAALMEVPEDLMKLRMEAVFSGAEIHRAERQAGAEASDLIEGETVDAVGVAVAVGAGQVAVVREPEPDDKAVLVVVHRHVLLAVRWTSTGRSPTCPSPPASRPRSKRTLSTAARPPSRGGPSR